MTRLEFLLILSNLKNEVNSRIKNPATKKGDYQKYVELSSQIAKKLECFEIDYVTANKLLKFGNVVFSANTTSDKLCMQKAEIEEVLSFLKSDILNSNFCNSLDVQ